MPLADSIFNMYERTGRGISQGLGSIGETRRENARLRYEGRRAGLEEPALRLQSEQAQQKLDFMNAPFRIDSLVPKGKDVNTTMAWLTDDYIGDIAKTFGAEIDPEQGVLMKNGKVVTNRMAAPFMNNIVASVISAKQDPGHAFNSRMEQLQSKVNEGTATEQDITNLKKMTDLKNNPIEFENWIKGQHEQNIMTNANRRAYFKQMGADPFVLDASDARSVRKINNITSNQQAREKERSELAKEERKFKRELILEGIKQKGIGKNKKYIIDIGRGIKKEFNKEDMETLKNYQQQFIDSRTTYDTNGKKIKPQITLKDTYMLMDESGELKESINKIINDSKTVKPETTQARIDNFKSDLKNNGMSDGLIEEIINSIEDNIDND